MTKDVDKVKAVDGFRRGLDRLIKRHAPPLTISELFEAFHAVIANEHGYADTVSAAGRTLRLHQESTVSVGDRKVEREQAKKDIEARAHNMMSEIVQNVFSLTMINGKPFGDCTKDEIEAHGAGFERVASFMRDGQTVREAMTEEVARALLAGAKVKRAA